MGKKWCDRLVKPGIRDVCVWKSGDVDVKVFFRKGYIKFLSVVITVVPVLVLVSQSGFRG